MNELRMPTTLPSPVDRGEFWFVAVDDAGDEWRWLEDELVWVRVRAETDPHHGDPEERHVLHQIGGLAPALTGNRVSVSDRYRARMGSKEGRGRVRIGKGADTAAAKLIS